MENEPKTINLLPTPEGYARACIRILCSSESTIDKSWAANEIVKAFNAAASLNPKAWGQRVYKRESNKK